MTNPDDIRISRNADMYGAVRSIVAYRGSVEIGRAVYSMREWLIGPSNILNADDFDITIKLNPAWSNETMINRVEILLRLSISAAEAGSRRAA